MDIDRIRRLEEMTFNAMPALETGFFEGWVVRSARGVTGRANSASAFAPWAAPVEAVHPSIEALYGARGLKPRFRLTPLAPAASADLLRAAGYEEESGALVMTGPVPAGRADDGVVLSAMSDRAWIAAYARAAGRFGPAEQDILGEMHRVIQPATAFARIVEDGRIVAHGMAVVERGTLSLHEIGTQPEARRRGLAQRVIAALSHWGRERGAREAFLQVGPENAPAIALYARLGFATLYDYTYFVGSGVLSPSA